MAKPRKTPRAEIPIRQTGRYYKPGIDDINLSRAKGLGAAGLLQRQPTTVEAPRVISNLQRRANQIAETKGVIHANMVRRAEAKKDAAAERLAEHERRKFGRHQVRIDIARNVAFDRELRKKDKKTGKSKLDILLDMKVTPELIFEARSRGVSVGELIKEQRDLAQSRYVADAPVRVAGAKARGEITKERIKGTTATKVAKEHALAKIIQSENVLKGVQATAGATVGAAEAKAEPEKIRAKTEAARSAFDITELIRKRDLIDKATEADIYRKLAAGELDKANAVVANALAKGYNEGRFLPPRSKQVVSQSRMIFDLQIKRLNANLSDLEASREVRLNGVQDPVERKAINEDIDEKAALVDLELYNLIEARKKLPSSTEDLQGEIEKLKAENERLRSQQQPAPAPSQPTGPATSSTQTEPLSSLTPEQNQLIENNLNTNDPLVQKALAGDDKAIEQLLQRIRGAMGVA